MSEYTYFHCDVAVIVNFYHQNSRYVYIDLSYGLSHFYDSSAVITINSLNNITHNSDKPYTTFKPINHYILYVIYQNSMTAE